MTTEQERVVMGDRGSGRTTRQMVEAKTGSIYVWCNHLLDYPINLSEKLDRLDLIVVSPSMLERRDRLRGVLIVDVVVDHAAELSGLQRDGLETLLMNRRYDP